MHSEMPRPSLGHVTLEAADPAALVEFYRDLFGMRLTGGSRNGRVAFLGWEESREHHVLGFVPAGTTAHIALRVESLAELRTAYQTAIARGLLIKAANNHGVSLAFFIEDPERNLVEVYWDTGRRDVRSPFLRAIDLTQSEEALMSIVEAPHRPPTTGDES